MELAEYSVHVEGGVRRRGRVLSVFEASRG